MRTDRVLRAPVDIVDRLDDVLAGLVLLVGGHRVFEVEEDHVGLGLRRLLEHLRARAGHRELASG